MRFIRKIMTAMSLGSALLGTGALAAPPTIEFGGDGIHVITFTTPGVYDFSVDEQTVDGFLDHRTLISHDLKGRIEGVITDSDGDLKLVTTIDGKVKTSGGIPVMTTKLQGYGDFGNGDKIRSTAKKRSEVHGLGAAATLFTTITMKTCVLAKVPVGKDKYNVTCSKGGGTHESPLGSKGDWEIRIQGLAEPGLGQLIGTGEISTNIHSSKFKRTTPVLVTGKRSNDGTTAKIKLEPIDEGGDGPVTIVAEVIAGPGVLHPAITAVLEVKGKLLGQKFNEVTQ